MASQINKTQSEIILKRKKCFGETKPNLQRAKKIYSKKNQSFFQNSCDISALNDSQVEICPMLPSLSQKITRITPLNEIYSHADKANYYARKLSYMLTNKLENEGFFKVYSKIYSEIAEFFPEFKEILQILRKGLALSAINERHHDNFEFKNDINSIKGEIGTILKKKQQKTEQLLIKLNNLSQEHEKLQNKYEKLRVKFKQYKQAVYNDPAKYIEAEKVMEKMWKQCRIIRKQKDIIFELTNSEQKLKKMYEICKNSGIELESLIEDNKHTVINPSIKLYLRSKSRAMSDCDDSPASCNNR